MDVNKLYGLKVEGAISEGEFFSHLRQHVLRMARRDEDITQDALLKIWGALGNFRGDCKFSTWVWTVVRSAASRSLRKSHVEDQSLRDSEGVEVVTSDLSVLDVLPPSDRVIFEGLVDGKSYFELAQEMNLPLGVIRKRIYITRKVLQHAISQQK